MQSHAVNKELRFAWSFLIMIGSFLVTGLLDLKFHPDLIKDSNNLTIYIMCHILLIISNGSLLAILIFFLDSARVDCKRTNYLMQALTSTIQSDEGC